jgi:hypothetical protein
MSSEESVDSVWIDQESSAAPNLNESPTAGPAEVSMEHLFQEIHSREA